MRSVLYEEMDIIWSKYRKTIKKIGFAEFLSMPERQIKNVLTLNFAELFEEVKQNAKNTGKTRGQISYSVLKLKRLIALWKQKGVMTGDFEITYKNDVYGDFPLFNKQNFKVAPTINTVENIKATIIEVFLNRYNRQVKAMRQQGNNAFKYVTNLKDLRMFLISKIGIDSNMATRLTNSYKTHSAKNEVTDFSENLKLF